MAFRDAESALRAEVAALRAELREAVDIISRLSGQAGDARTERAAGPCVECGSTELQRGQLKADGLRFETKDAGWASRNLSAAISLPATRCARCKHVTLVQR